MIKGGRKIVVDGIEYQYKVYGKINEDYLNGIYENFISRIAICNIGTNKTRVFEVKETGSFTPTNVADFIRSHLNQDRDTPTYQMS